MAADTFKMGTFVGIVFCALIMSGKIMGAENTVYSSVDTALKFSQCLIEKMSESQFFTEDDRNSMIEVRDVMSRALSIKKKISAKVLVVAFITSLSDIITLNDPSKNAYRKGVYVSALEQCSISSVGYVDPEFMEDTQKILAVIENSRIQTNKETSAFVGTGEPVAGSFGSVSYPQQQGTNNQFAVQPSPVQNLPAPQNFYPNDKTVSEQQQMPNLSPIASSSEVAVNSQYANSPSSQIDLSSNFATQAQSKNLPERYDHSGVAQTGGFSSSFVSGSQYENFPVGSGVGGLSASEIDLINANSRKFPPDYDTHGLQHTAPGQIESSSSSVSNIQHANFPVGSNTGAVPQSEMDLINRNSRRYPSNYDVNGQSQVAKSQTGSSSSFVSSTDDGNFPVVPDVGGKLYYERDSRVRKFPYDYDIGGRPDIGNGRSDALSHSETHIGQINEGNASQIYNGGLNVPQTKESSVIVIPPQTNQQIASDEHLTHIPEHGKKEESHQPPKVENNPESGINDFSMSSPVTIPQTEQYSEFTSYPELENIVFNILLNSQNFRETFNSEISQENAIHLAQSFTEKTFAEFDSNLRNDALHIVSEEVAKVKIPTPENFAFALSNGLVLVLKKHDTTLPTEQTQFARNFLSSLYETAQFNLEENTEKQSYGYSAATTTSQIYTEQDNVDNQSYTGEAANSEFVEKQWDFDFQSPPLSPEYRKYEIFSMSLEEHLSESEAIRNHFCDETRSEDAIQISFSIIKASLTDYGSHVATLAASVASGTLSELSKEALCYGYAKTISEIVAEILDENGVEGVDAATIANKMEQNLIQRQITPTESQKPPTLPSNISQNVQETESYPDVTTLESSFTPVKDINPDYQEETEQPNLTPSDIENDSSVEYTYPMTLQNISTSLATPQPSESPEDWTQDDILEEESFTDYLINTFESLTSYILEKNENLGVEESFFTVDDKGAEEFSSSSSQYIEESSNPAITEDENKNSYHQEQSKISQEDETILQSTSSVDLQPSFQSPVPQSEGLNSADQKNLGFTSVYTDSPVTLAREISETAESSIAFIRSQNFDLNTLCMQINLLAPIVNIPILDYCEPIAAIDYLLNVLRALIGIMIQY